MPKVIEAQIEYHYQQACEIALKEVERRARLAMREGPRLIEFVNAMGISFFTTEEDGYAEENLIKYPAAKPTMDLICEWDQYLKLSGCPMRFTADGPVERNW